MTKYCQSGFSDMVPTSTGKLVKMGVHFPIIELCLLNNFLYLLIKTLENGKIAGKIREILVRKNGNHE